jgi:hypothetical protein
LHPGFYFSCSFLEVPTLNEGQPFFFKLLGENTENKYAVDVDKCITDLVIE